MNEHSYTGVTLPAVNVTVFTLRKDKMVIVRWEVI